MIDILKRISLSFLVIFLFFYIGRNFPVKSTNKKNPEFDETRKRAIEGIVTRSYQARECYIDVDSERIYYQISDIIYESVKSGVYLIQQGDSIYKAQNSDTFYVFRKQDRFIYLLQ